MKKYTALFAGAFAALVALPATAGETLDRIMEKGVMVLSSDAAYPPQSFLNDANEMDGFDVDVAREVANRMGVELEIVTPSWDIITAGNWNGRWDVSIGSMTPTAERAQVLDFPAVYYYVPAAFAVHSDSTAASKADLSGKTIGVCGGCTYDLYLQQDLTIDAEGVPAFAYDVKTDSVKTYETDTSVFDDLRIGDGARLDVAFSAMPTILEAIKSGYPMKIVGEPAFFEPLAVATDKGDAEFDAKLTEIINAMHEDGTLTALSEKWFGVDYTKS